MVPHTVQKIQVARQVAFSICSLLLCALVDPVIAQVKLDRVFPPAVAIGSETQVIAEGKFPSWPPNVICDREDIAISFGEKSGELKVAVSDDATPGVAWVRMHDDQAASDSIPLLIEPQSPVTESEPNDSTAEANPVELPGILVGKLAKSGEIDTYKISVRSGQKLVATVIANQWLQSPMDAILQLSDENGNVIAQQDDSRGLDPELIHDVREDGELYLRIFAFPETPTGTIGYAGAASFAYAIRVTTGPVLHHVSPVIATTDPREQVVSGWNMSSDLKVHRSADFCFAPPAMGWFVPKLAPSKAVVVSDGEVTDGPIQLPCVFAGHLLKAGEIDRVRFTVQKGTRYQLKTHAREFGFPVDTVLRVVDPAAGSELARNDDRQREQFDSELEYVAKADGVVELQVSDLVDGYGPTHAYAVIIQAAVPHVQPSIPEDHFSLQLGKDVEITVTVARMHRFGKRLRFVAEGLPPGVTATPVISEPKDGTAKTVKLKLVAAADAKLGACQFQLLGQALDEDGKPTGPVFPVNHHLRPLWQNRDFWLVVHK